MTSFAKIASALALSGLALSQAAAPVQAGEGFAKSVTPFKAINLSAGTKRAIGYYVADAGTCHLTLQLADAYSDYANSVSEPVRVDVSVREGTSARVDSLAGPSLQFDCAQGASSMTIQPVDRTAYVAPAK